MHRSDLCIYASIVLSPYRTCPRWVVIQTRPPYLYDLFTTTSSRAWRFPTRRLGAHKLRAAHTRRPALYDAMSQRPSSRADGTSPAAVITIPSSPPAPPTTTTTD